MASKSPGSGGVDGASGGGGGDASPEGSFFGRMVKSRSSKEKKQKMSSSTSSMTVTGGETSSSTVTTSTMMSSAMATETRMETAYHGKRTDARDRSSEDPRRHRIPRASVTPPKVDVLSSEGEEEVKDAAAAAADNGKPRPKLRRKKSLEKTAGQRATRERTLEREKRVSSRSRDRALVVTTDEVSRSASTATSTFYRVEKTVQMSHSFKGVKGTPPIPPPRTFSKRSVLQHQQQSSEMSFEVHLPVATSTPSKMQTPYQFWREQRLRSSQVSSEPSKIKPVKAFESEPQLQQQPQHQQPAKSDSSPGLFGRFKSKRERSASGTSTASSSTAEPHRKLSAKVAAAAVAANAETASIGSNGSASSRTKKSLSNLFGTLTRKKSKEELSQTERKTSTTATLIRSAVLLNPDFHKAVMKTDKNGSSTSPPQMLPPPQHSMMGTVLHPRPPRGRTPFQEWRHYRQQQHQRLLQQRQQQPQQMQQQSLGVQLDAHYRHTPSPRLLRTPDPDYDTMSVGSAVSSNYRSSKEDLRPKQVGPGYYATAGRSASSLGIPRFHAQRQQQGSPKPRTRSLAGESPRMSGAPLHGVQSGESHEWYTDFQQQVPHDKEFGSNASFGGKNYDGRIQAAIGEMTKT
jgi:hypothetical protein